MVNTLSSKFREDHIRDHIGDVEVVDSPEQAEQLQWAIEKATRQKLGFEIRSGDIVLAQFKNLPKVGKVGRLTNESIGHTIVRDVFLSKTMFFIAKNRFKD